MHLQVLIFQKGEKKNQSFFLSLFLCTWKVTFPNLYIAQSHFYQCSSWHRVVEFNAPERYSLGTLKNYVHLNPLNSCITSAVGTKFVLTHCTKPEQKVLGWEITQGLRDWNQNAISWRFRFWLYWKLCCTGDLGNYWATKENFPLSLPTCTFVSISLSQLCGFLRDSTHTWFSLPLTSCQVTTFDP